MATKKLIVAVEGTAAIGSNWQTIVSDYLDKIIRCFCGNDPTGQKPSTHVELSLVMFGTHGPYSACLVRRSAWTRDMDIFFQWLSAISFAGGGFSDAAIAEGLAETLMMLTPPSGNQTQNVEGERHCILVAASNPYPLPTPVYRPQFQNPGKTDSIETQSAYCLSDAETVAKCFAQCAITLSIICPRQLQKLRAIYNAAKHDPLARDLPVYNAKNPHFLVLISEEFMEARSSLGGSGPKGLPSNQNPAKMDVTPVPPISGPPPASAPSGNRTVVVRPPESVGNVLTPTAKLAPTTLASETRPKRLTYVKIWEGNLQVMNQDQLVIITRLEGFRLASASETLAAKWPQAMEIERLIPVDHMNKENAAKADILPFWVSSEHSSLERLKKKNLCAVVILPSQTLLLKVSDEPLYLIGMLFPGCPIPLPSATRPELMTHVKIWEGNLQVMNQDQLVIITRLEGFMLAFASETLAAKWPQAMEIERLIPVDHMNKENAAKADILTFRALSQHKSLERLKKKMLCAVIILPSQTLLLKVSDEPLCLIGMLFPGCPIPLASATRPELITHVKIWELSNLYSCVGFAENLTLKFLPYNSRRAISNLKNNHLHMMQKHLQGNLHVMNQDQLVIITRLEGFMLASASETLAAKWPQAMEIERLIPVDHMNHQLILCYLMMENAAKADILTFRALSQHSFLERLKKKKLCAVIILPSQTLLLKVSDEPLCLIGMLFTGERSQSVNVVQSPMHLASATRPELMTHVKIWEGNLQVMNQDQLVIITRLEGFRLASASETLAAKWPQAMEIERLIPVDHMNKENAAKADILTFRASTQHSFLERLKKEKLCAVIILPSQTLLLSLSEKPLALIGMLFRGVCCKDTNVERKRKPP